MISTHKAWPKPNFGTEAESPHNGRPAEPYPTPPPSFTTDIELGEITFQPAHLDDEPPALALPPPAYARYDVSNSRWSKFSLKYFKRPQARRVSRQHPVRQYPSRQARRTACGRWGACVMSACIAAYILTVVVLMAVQGATKKDNIRENDGTPLR